MNNPNLIEKIIESLAKTADDKKTFLDSRYNEHSDWLASEFEIIKSLITRSPEDFKSDKTTSSTKNTSNASNLKSTNQQVAKSHLTEDSNKRKLSDVQLGSSLLSPEQKRISCSTEELLVQAGLPDDLNRLTKDQLLKELANRAQLKNLSMKSLKKDLIAALKKTLQDEFREAQRVAKSPFTKEFEEDVQILDEEEEEEEEEEMQCESKKLKDHNSKHVRASSLRSMADIRNSVTNAAAVRESLSGKNDANNIENEFKARKDRASISRKSIQMQEQDKEENKDKKRLSENTGNTWMEVASPQPNPTNAQVVEMIPSKENIVESETVKKESSDLTEQNVQTVDDNASMPSDEVDIEEKRISLVNNVAIELNKRASGKGTSLTVDEIKPVQSVSNSPPKDSSKVSTETSAKVTDSSTTDHTSKVESLDAATKVGSTVAGTVQKETVIPVKLVNTTATTTAVVSTVPMAKKPSNLVNLGGQTSFMSSKFENSNLPSKPQQKNVVPALLKAQKLKAAEELREKTRKEDLASKMAALKLKQQQLAAKSKSVISKTASNNNLSSKIGEDSNNKPSVVKGGIFSAAANMMGFSKSETNGSTKSNKSEHDMISSKKPTVSTSTDISTSSGSSVKSAFDISVVDLKTSPPVIPPVSSTSGKSGMLESNANPPIVNIKKTEETLVASVTTSLQQKPFVLKIDTEKANEVMNSSLPEKDTVKTIVAQLNAAKAPPVPPQPIKSPTKSPLYNAKTSVKSPSPKAASAVPVQNVKPIAAPLQENKTILTEQNKSPEKDYENEYQIEDREDSDDSGSGTDDDDDTESRKKQQQSVPEWAKGPKLREALERQYGLLGNPPIDPDTIFPEVQTCSLEAIFGVKQGINKKYSQRSSSAHWDADEITLVEKRAYRKHMGYDAHKSKTVAAL